MSGYPRLIFNTEKLRHNVLNITSACKAAGISVCGIIKGCDGMISAAKIMEECACAQIGSSRIYQLKECLSAGIKLPLMLIRIPAPSEVQDVALYCDISLQSEKSTLALLNKECEKSGKKHSVIIMADLGDLREGFWDKEEFLNVCLFAERELPFIHLMGIGVNLGCYGSILPTPAKMNELSALASAVEKLIGRRLEIISGGATSSYMLVHSGNMPHGINHLRIGENMLIAKDLKELYGIRDLNLMGDVFTLRAEVLEVKDKPSFPQGERGTDAFGNRPEYKDIGIRRRALLSLGRADVGELESLVPLLKGAFVVGGASDLLILDVTEAEREIKCGDTVDFSILYIHLLYASARPDVYIEEI